MLTPIPQRPWGRVSELARLYGVSRQLFYEMRERVLQAAAEALSPRRPGLRPQILGEADI